MEGGEEEGRDEEGWDVNGTLSPRQGGEAQSSITESEPTVTSAQIENDGNGEGDPDADDYSARDRKMKQREKEEGEEEEDDLSSYRGITSMISKIQPVDMGGNRRLDFTLHFASMKGVYLFYVSYNPMITLIARRA